MPMQDIIVIGASAGGVEALQVLAAGLPAVARRDFRRTAYRTRQQWPQLYA
ncbi:MAG: hypothetical protein ABI604_15675 [Nitrospirota bacterium]